jgi:hypothetical protein
MEKRTIVDQRRLAIESFFAAHGERLGRQGAIVSTWRRRGDRRLGPYYLLVTRDAAGRQHTVYLGRSVALVAEVRMTLSSLQASNRRRQKTHAARKALRRSLAAAKRQYDLELAKVGLRRQGNEVRGWAARGRGWAAGGGAADRLAMARPRLPNRPAAAAAAGIVETND